MTCTIVILISFTDRMSFLDELSEFEFLKKLRKDRSVEQEARFKDLQKEMRRIKDQERHQVRYNNLTTEEKEKKRIAQQITRGNYSKEKAEEVKYKNTEARKDARAKWQVTLLTYVV